VYSGVLGRAEARLDRPLAPSLDLPSLLGFIRYTIDRIIAGMNLFMNLPVLLLEIK
jgi:hypothetical protein